MGLRNIITNFERFIVNTQQNNEHTRQLDYRDRAASIWPRQGQFFGVRGQFFMKSLTHAL